MNVLVTGASGLIGRHAVARLLDTGHAVRTFQRRAPVHKEVEHVAGDVLVDREKLCAAARGQAAVVHLAGRGDVGESRRDPVRSADLNATGALYALDAARAAGAAFVLASTQRVYPLTPEPCREAVDLAPDSPYGYAKWVAELWCRMASENFGVPTTVLRFFSVYGPGQQAHGGSGVVSIFARAALAGTPLQVQSAGRRDFVHAQDAADAITRAVDRSHAGGRVYNVGTGIGTTFQELAKLVVEIARSPSSIEERISEPPGCDLVADISRARGDLGYAPCMPLRDGLERYVEWLQHDSALKARPTPAQLADRLRPIDGRWPDGIELYLAAADLADLDAVGERILAAQVPAGFAWLIEGPVDSLDGGDFDVTRESPADREVVERLAELARRIRARAVNIHVIAPSADTARLTLECRSKLLQASVPFLSSFVELVQNSGAVPTVENMPPVLRMRRSDFAFTPIGMASEDLRWLVERVPGLKTMPDTSHAGLYLNARRLPPDPRHAWSAPLHAYLTQLPADPIDLLGYIRAFPEVENAQVSNAQGVLGEGLPYSVGDFELDPVIGWFQHNVKHVVTETIEDSNDDAANMRDALRRMRAVVA